MHPTPSAPTDGRAGSQPLLTDAAGELADDDELEREGQRDRAAGKVKEKAEQAKDKANELVDKVKDAVNKNR